MADAVFTEVLELSIDAEGFASALQEIESAFNDFADRLSEKSEGIGAVASVGEFADLKNQLSELQGYLQEFDASVTQSFDSLDSGIAKVDGHITLLEQDLADAKAAAADLGDESEKTGTRTGNTFESLKLGILGSNEGLIQMLAHLAELRALWSAVGLVLDPIFALLRSPVTFFEDGIKYLKDLQDSSASLQGVIAANAKYSGDMAENFRLAGVAAQSVVLQLQELAIATGIPLANLQKTFESLLQSGALHFVSTMQDVVKLSEDFSILMQAAGSGLEGQRRILQDIPQLLEGSVSASSRILEVLGLTRDQWAAIRAEAQAHGNLVQLLAPYMLPYLSVVQQANERQTALTQSLELQGQRIAGAVALPIWQAWINFLQQAKGFLDTNEQSLVSLGQSSVNLAEEFGRFVLELAEGLTGTTSLDSVVKSIVLGVNNLVGAFRILIEFISTMAHEAGVFADSIVHPFDAMFNADRFNKQIDAFEANYKAKVKEIYEAGNTVALGYDKNAFFDEDGNFKGAPGLKNILNANVEPNKPLVDQNADKEAKARFSELQQNYRAELTETQEHFKTVEASIKAQLESGDINFRQSAAARRTAIQDQFADINQLIEKYKSLASASQLDPKDLQKFVSQLNQLQTKTNASTTVDLSSANADEQKQEQELQQKHDNDLRNLEIQHSKLMLELYKQEADAGLHTKTEVFDKEQELSSQEHAATIGTLQEQLTAAKNNETERLTILDRLAAEDQRYTDQQATSANTRAALLNKESAEHQAFAEREIATQRQIDRLQVESEQLHGVVSTKAAADNVRLAQLQVIDAQAALADATAHLEAAKALGVHGEALDKLVLEQENAQKQLAQAQVDAQKAQQGTGSGQFDQEVFGQDVSNLHDAFTGFDRSVESIGNAFKFFAGAVGSMVNAIENGYKNGGAVGAIGGGASQLGSLLSASNPVLGSIIGGVGSIFSLIGNLFTQRAKEITQDIQQAVANLQEAYSTQQISLTQTIQGLEEQRNQAIQQLSGAKGGQDQLNQLLPGLDNQIAQMQFQASQIVLNFNNMAASLHLQSSTLGDILTTWQNINKQVTDYLGAGGDAATAAQVLSDTLQQQLTNAQSSLSDAENQAVQDALKLNDLLQQRADLEKQLAQQLFDIQNSDSLEREGNPVIDNAIAYQEQSQQAALQLQALNSQIDLMTKRVDMESQVFQIASDTASLEQGANQLNLDALQKTIQQWQDLKTLISSIYQNPDGSFGLNTSGLTPAAPGPVPTALTFQSGAIVINAGSDVNGADLATQLLDALNNETQFVGRSGS